MCHAVAASLPDAGRRACQTAPGAGSSSTGDATSQTFSNNIVNADPRCFRVRLRSSCVATLQEGVNASSRFLASSQIVQNVRAIEDMRDLLLQEHSLTIKVSSRK